MEIYTANGRIIYAKRIKYIQVSADALLAANQIKGRYYLKNITQILGCGYRYVTAVVYIDEFDQEATTYTYDVQKIKTLEQWKKIHGKV